MSVTDPSEDILGFLNSHKSGEEVFTLSSGQKVSVPKYSLVFKKWEGTPIKNTYGNKPVIDLNGEPVFAELALLRLFQKSGWDGVWVDSFGKRNYRIGLPGIVDPSELPKKENHILEEIYKITGKSGGCWDVFVWKDNKILFLELKRLKKDRIQNSQDEWLEASLSSGLQTSNFGLVEWGFNNSKTARVL